MSKLDKLLQRLNSATKTFPWQDLLSLLSQLGFVKKEMAGSRVRFYQPETKHMILLHKPHPENYIKGGALKDIRNTLQQGGYL